MASGTDPQRVRLALLSRRVVTGTRPAFSGHVAVAEGKIASVGPGPPPESFRGRTVDVGDAVVGPGLVDLHVHGAGGHCPIWGGAAEVGAMAVFLAQRGTSAFRPTLMGEPERVKALLTELGPLRMPPGAARLVGVHLEGPFLNPARRGACDERFLRPVDTRLMEELLRAAPGLCRQVTLAPELDGAPELISWLTGEGVLVAAGHSDATYCQARGAFEAGVRHITHLFNAMRPFHHREPGLLGAALEDDRVSCELIADGIHLHPAALRLAFRLKGARGVCLVSDASPAAGMPPGEYRFLGREVLVDGSGACRFSDGTLAGSSITLADAVAFVVRHGVASWEEAFISASLVPARLAGVSHRKGTLEVGKDADLVVMNDAGEVLWSLVGGVVMRAPDR